MRILDRVKDKKTLYFGISGAIGGLISSIIFLWLGIQMPITTWVVSTALDCLFISSFLILAQDLYIHRGKFSYSNIFKSIIISLIGGSLGGYFASTIGFSLSNLLGLSVDFGRILGWGICGAVAGVASSFGIPNLKAKNALIGGTIGGIIGVLLMYILGSYKLGVIITGFFIGLSVVFAEMVFRKAWLEVELFYGKGKDEKSEKYTISLGSKPLIIGYESKVDIRIKGEENLPSKTAVIELKNGIIEFNDLIKNKSVNLKHGSKIRVSNAQITVMTSKNND